MYLMLLKKVKIETKKITGDGHPLRHNCKKLCFNLENK